MMERKHGWDRHLLQPWVLVTVICCFMATRLVTVLWSPFELSPDEAYYWDWSRQLAWGYYSKPPMVAWIIAASCSIFGDNEIGVRLPATIMSVAAVWFLYLTGKEIGGRRVGLMAAAVSSATVGGAVGAYIMTIDAPLLLFWSMSLFFMVRLLMREERSLLQWLLTGLVVGAGLLSKQTMIALPAAFLAFLLLHPDHRHLVLGPGPWIFLAAILACLIPTLLWNHHHGWITLIHTAHHFEPSDRGLTLRYLGDLLGSQLGLSNPVIFPLYMVAGAFVGWACLGKILGWSSGGCGGKERSMSCLLFLAGPALMAAVILLSLRQRVNANWPAPFHAAGFVLAALVTAGGGRQDGWPMLPGLLRQKASRLFALGLVIGCVLTACFHTLPIWISSSPIYGTKADPTVRLRGWKELALMVDQYIEQAPRPESTVVITRKRQTASELAFYLAGQPRVFEWPSGRIRSQYDLWPGPVVDGGSAHGGGTRLDAVVVVLEDKGLPPGIRESFSRFESLGTGIIPLGNGNSRRYRFWMGYGLETWNGGGS